MRVFINMRVPKLSEVNNREKNQYIESRFLTFLILKIQKTKWVLPSPSQSKPRMKCSCDVTALVQERRKKNIFSTFYAVINIFLKQTIQTLKF